MNKQITTFPAVARCRRIILCMAPAYTQIKSCMTPATYTLSFITTITVHNQTIISNTCRQPYIFSVHVHFLKPYEQTVFEERDIVQRGNLKWIIKCRLFFNGTSGIHNIYHVGLQTDARCCEPLIYLVPRSIRHEQTTDPQLLHLKYGLIYLREIQNIIMY